MAKAMASGEFTREEVGLALRNPGMPLEGLRYHITPIEMHYLLVYSDIPFVDPETYELTVGGRVRAPLSLTLDELKARPAVTMPVMMECAGAGAPLSAAGIRAVARRGHRVLGVDGDAAAPHPRGDRSAQ